MTPASYFIYREQNHVFEDIGIYQTDSVSVTGVADPEQVRALDVTESVLPILGVAPHARPRLREARRPAGAPDTIMLSFAFWQRKFGSDPNIIGRRLTVEGEPREIIGVMPRRFTFLDHEDRGILLPLKLDRATTQLGNYSYEGLARLKPGMTIADANADVARMLPIVVGSFPPPAGSSVDQFKNAGIGPNVRPLMHDVVGDIGTVLWVLMASIGLVLLIACANVANLLLVRAEGRQQELAIRAALGASRGRIAAELLVESIVIGLLGGVLGLAFAYGAIRLLVAMAPAGAAAPRRDRPRRAGAPLHPRRFAPRRPALRLRADLQVRGCRHRTPTSAPAAARRARAASGTAPGARWSSSRSALALRAPHRLGPHDPHLSCAHHRRPRLPRPGDRPDFRISIPEADAKEPEQVIRTEEAILARDRGASPA